MGCEIGNDLILSWPYMKYFVDFYTRKPKSDAGENYLIGQGGPILFVFFWPPTLAASVYFVNYDLGLGASTFTPFVVGCSV